MIITGIILLIIGVIVLVGIFITEDKEYRSILIIFGMVILYLGTAFVYSESTEKYTAIDCLKGNNPYKMEIKYELKDSVYIPCDTIYVKIN